MAWHRRGFTLVELLVVIAVITILASLVMPAALRTLDQASAVQCRSNLRQIAKANFDYAKDNDYFLPCYGDSYAWHGYEERFISPPWLVFKYLAEMEDIYVCPTDPTPENCVWWSLNHFTLTKSSYMWNEHVMTIDDGKTGGAAWPITNYPRPVELGLVADGWECPNGWTWATCLPPRLFASSRIDWEHHGSVNMVYLDWHVVAVSHSDVANVDSNPR